MKNITCFLMPTRRFADFFANSLNFREFDRKLRFLHERIFASTGKSCKISEDSQKFMSDIFYFGSFVGDQFNKTATASCKGRLTSIWLHLLILVGFSFYVHLLHFNCFITFEMFAKVCAIFPVLGLSSHTDL